MRKLREKFRSRLWLFLPAVLCLVAAADAPSGGISRAAARRQTTALQALGARLFRDPTLSASGQLSCASCHSPAHGFGPANALPVQMGGTDMAQTGTRAAPSLTYLEATPPFTEHYFDSDDDGDGSTDNGPTGGLTWDGRVDRGRDQARIPLLSAREMANRDPAEAAARLEKAGYATALRRILGVKLTMPDQVFDAAVEALEVYEQDYRVFYPYSSRYDAFLAGKAKLSPAEARGLALFEDPDKGNCSSCHISRPANNGSPPEFTDYGLIAIGVPRNRAIPVNDDPAYFDLGLCGPDRTDFRDRPTYCGLFKTPSLRNVALRQSFMHNGVFHSLRQVMEFYVERDTDPGKWYARRPDGTVEKYDDLPAIYHDNVNVDPPFDRKPGDKPALDAAEIDDVIAFLGTLTDGYGAAR
ncbi:MAG TPA: cytochrome c peroxidase [Aliidongia sp.]|uniref:cytochrome-c peroxidase n=1 Tax=Aliidongia sp. TaxID=1914230 RepID=UPI002DDD43DE|nr:cytochrome c peroxidase [Aliidongia sp.]HEV2678388.1 cytochrome c peroxidase [Aliidongia sp.]